ncbi:DUF6876 family protein [Microcoleus sp. FACHB-672]|uniref:DUF6876 family protein n=1 Tax=Microcoleus sp. FACHB-672 TaxID=2692825 RepID=UPI001689E75E|nr:DUF6876 family protein [Microcoleus sp. FACHB-672]MBD2039219.1 hypothetical protein [Microcoleus sp. FACHB-672]
MLEAEKLEAALPQFNGTNTYFKHILGLSYTDGLKFLAENAECYWLIDAIASHQIKALKNPRLKDFQLWILAVGDSHEFIKPSPGNNAILTCWEDTPVLGVKPPITQQIEFTDFPLPVIKFYLENSVLMLPSER